MKPFGEFLAIVGATGIVTFGLLYASGAIHCVNLPIFGLKCAIG